MIKLFSAFWEQIPFQSPLSMDNHMDVEQLDVVVQITSYMSFDTIDDRGGLAKGANIFTFTKGTNIANMFLRHYEEK